MTYIPPNPNGQATSANSAPVVIASDQTALPITDNGGSLTIDAAALPLPTGAATAAKQPALGTAGTPSADVISVQGVSGGTAIPITGTVTSTPSGTQTISGTVAAGATDSGNPIKVGGKYNSASPVLTDGQRGDAQLDVNSTLKVVEQYAPVYEDNVVGVAKVEVRFSRTNITTNATTVVKSSGGLLRSISINNPAALTVANLVMTVYDNTAASGTKIGTWTIPFGVTTAMPFTIPLDVLFTTGLTVVTSGPTAAADITVIYR